MKQNSTIPAVLQRACGALSNIALSPENRVIAGAAGAIQVHVSAYTPPQKKDPRTTPHPAHLPMVLQALSIWYSTPSPLWYFTPLPMVLHHSPYGTPLLYMVFHHSMVLHTRLLFFALPSEVLYPFYMVLHTPLCTPPFCTTHLLYSAPLWYSTPLYGTPPPYLPSWYSSIIYGSPR